MLLENRQATFNVQFPRDSQKRLAPKFVTVEEAEGVISGTVSGTPRAAAAPAAATTPAAASEPTDSPGVRRVRILAMPHSYAGAWLCCTSSSDGGAQALHHSDVQHVDARRDILERRQQRQQTAKPPPPQEEEVSPTACRSAGNGLGAVPYIDCSSLTLVYTASSLLH